MPLGFFRLGVLSKMETFSPLEERLSPFGGIRTENHEAEVRTQRLLLESVVLSEEKRASSFNVERCYFSNEDICYPGIVLSHLQLRHGIHWKCSRQH